MPRTLAPIRRPTRKAYPHRIKISQSPTVLLMLFTPIVSTSMMKRWVSLNIAQEPKPTRAPQTPKRLYIPRGSMYD
jgi:hypothetical protein